MENKIVLGGVMALLAGTALAQTDPIDIGDLNGRMLNACPVLWEDIKIDIDPSLVTGDHWQGDTTDRDAFKTFIATELGASAPDGAGLDTMADDVATVAAECATQRLGLLDGLINKLPNDALTAIAAVSEQIEGDVQGVGQFGLNIISVPHVAVPGAEAQVYELEASDFANPLIVRVDISEYSVVVRERDLSEMSGIVDYVIVDDAGTGSDHAFYLGTPDEEEIATGFRAGYKIRIAYDGETRTILDETRVARIELALTADDKINDGDEEKIFVQDYAVIRNDGNLWDAAVNHAITLEFDAGIEAKGHVQVDHDDITVFFKTGGIKTVHHNDQKAARFSYLADAFDLDALQALEVYANNRDNDTDHYVEGSNNQNETRLIFDIYRRR